MAKIKNVAVQMDHVAGINIAGDSTFAMSLEAQTRGYKLFHYTPERLSFRDGNLYATVEPMVLRDVKGDHFELGAPERVDLSTMDVILLRQDPPFDMAYITSTHLLERIHPKTLVVNDPAWVRNSPEKIFVTEFADLMPKTLITKDAAEIRRFRDEMGDIILKPLYGNGGAGVFHSTRDDRNLSSLLEMFGQLFREPFIAQQYLPDVRKGDKRILLVDGEPIDYCLARIPQGDEFRGNLAAGGRGEGRPLSERDRWIAAQVGPEMRRRGMVFVGLDVIGDWLTEVNVTSPTCIRELDSQFGLNIAGTLFDAIEARMRVATGA